MNQYKTCSKCRQEKPFDAFSAHNGSKASKSGIRSTCKSCDAAYNREYRARNPEKVKAAKSEWNKKNRHRMRPYEAMYREQNRQHLREYNSKWRKENREHVQQYAKSYRQTNIERKKMLDRLWSQSNKHKVNANSRRYRENHPEKVAAIKKEQAKRHPEVVKNAGMRRRARLANNSVYVVTKKDIVRIMRDPCIYCGAPSRHIDHVIPIAKGGAHKVGNLAPACQKCNQSKSSKFVSVWKAGK